MDTRAIDALSAYVNVIEGLAPLDFQNEVTSPSRAFPGSVPEAEPDAVLLVGVSLVIAEILGTDLKDVQ